ncbi:tetratricopeptide repeat protein [Larkinella soli]|uniref:tetratricopeptide repeat protein n=1 Tax=Larkinella soli TaxID=1770527 RepID=UPI000FFCA9A9|nr:tetratricopeptide repeat protein [Larkinella soli]
MTYLILSVLLWLWDNRSFDKIARNNIARMEAMKAYRSGAYEKAAEQYGALVRSSLFVEPSARLNLAHSYFHLRQLDQARRYYEQVAQVRRADLAATAAVQLGVIAVLKGDSATALTYFRKALDARPNDQAAQFNYELIRKTYSGQTPPTAGRKVKPRTRAAETESEVDRNAEPQGGNELENSDRRDELLRRLRSLNLSEEQVLNILNSMHDNEVQYIHQRKPKSSASAGRDFGKW